MKIFANNYTIRDLIECMPVKTASGAFNSGDDFLCFTDIGALEKHKLSIVQGTIRPMYYCVDLCTNLIIKASYSVKNIINWLDNIGYDLIDIQRQYDQVEYAKKVHRYIDFLTEKGEIYK